MRGADAEQVLGITQRSGSGAEDEVWTHGIIRYAGSRTTVSARLAATWS